MSSIWDVEDRPKPANTIFIAASRGQLERLVTLINDQGLDAVRLYVNDMNSFHIAVKKRHINIIEYLIQRDPDLIISTTEIKKLSSMMIASQEGYLDIVTLLCMHNHTNIHTTDTLGNTVLHYASWYGHLDIVQYLIENQYMNPYIHNNEDMTSLQMAAAGNHVSIVQYLSTLPLPITITTINTFLPNNQDIQFIINDADKDIHFSDDININMSLSHTNNTDNNNNNDNNNTKDNMLTEDISISGLNLLHRAVQNHAFDTIKYLVESLEDSNSSKSGTKLSDCSSNQKKIDINARTANGSTALHLACKHGYTDITIYLIQKGADIHVMNDYDLTPLHYVCIGGYKMIAEYLIHAGASIRSTILQSSSSSTNSSNHTATNSTTTTTNNNNNNNSNCNETRCQSYLHLAAQHGRHDICELLIHHLNLSTDDLLEKNEKGETAIELALTSGYKELASKLAKYTYVNLHTHELCKYIQSA